MTQLPLPPDLPLPSATPSLDAEVLRRRRWLRVPAPWRQPLAAVGVVVVGAWVVIAVFAPLIGPDNPLAQNYAHLGRAVVGALVRHRRTGPRRAVAGAVRRPDHAAAVGAAGRGWRWLSGR